MIYAQVVNGVVNLIGGVEVGLPFNNEIVASIDITDINENDRPKEGWFYKDGVFSQTGEYTILPPTELEKVFDYVLDVDFRVVMLEMGL